MNQIVYQLVDRVAYITLNRAEKRNALNAEMVAELMEAFIKADQDDKAKVVVLKGEGKAFCAGADLAYIQSLQGNSLEENLEDSNTLKKLFYKIYTMSKVVIAQVEGHALAGGCGLASVCDFTYAVPEAKFGYTEVRIGFIPAIVKVFLIRKIGEAQAKKLLLTGDIIDAQTALAMNLITEVCDKETIAQQVKTFADKLCTQNSGQSMAFTKKMIAEVQSKPLHDALDYAALMNAKARANKDCKDGIAAFLNKTPMTW